MSGPPPRRQVGRGGSERGIDPALVEPGFENPVLDSQACFRLALRALSRPGIALEVTVGLEPPPPLDPALAALALTLLDADTPVWLDPAADTPAVRTCLRFHCGCPLVEEPAAAAFGIVAAARAMPGLDAFDPGDEVYPDRSATLLVQLPSLDRGPVLTARGPGVDGAVTFAPAGLPDGFVGTWAANHETFPQGVDLFLVSDRRILGLPRGVALVAAGSREEGEACT